MYTSTRIFHFFTSCPPQIPLLWYSPPRCYSPPLMTWFPFSPPTHSTQQANWANVLFYRCRNWSLHVITSRLNLYTYGKLIRLQEANYNIAITYDHMKGTAAKVHVRKAIIENQMCTSFVDCRIYADMVSFTFLSLLLTPCQTILLLTDENASSDDDTLCMLCFILLFLFCLASPESKHLTFSTSTVKCYYWFYTFCYFWYLPFGERGNAWVSTVVFQEAIWCRTN